MKEIRKFTNAPSFLLFEFLCASVPLWLSLVK
jgi:hypothetical protein